MLEAEIKHILLTRDEAVLTKSAQLFLSVQANEIPNSGSDGYLSLAKLDSKLISAHSDEADKNQVVALVKETYWRNGSMSHGGYLLFYFQRDQSNALKIADIAWSNRSIP